MEWRAPSASFVPEALRAFVGGHPLVAERLARLGLTDPAAAAAFLDPAQYQCASAFELPAMEVAVARLQAALRTGEPVLIWGDFDVDGQAATAVLFSALKALGANVRYHIPRRNGEGHGLRWPKLRELLDHGYRLVITCDTGVTAHEAIAYAQRAGVDVVVTDHHQLPATLPPAHALVHPLRLPPGHRLRELPGVGVAYELIRALRGDVECAELFDLVALGIVADSARLQGETRYLLQRGLAALRVSSRPVWQALCARAEINQLVCDERDLAFSLVPRLNAQGRLAAAADAVELLTTTDVARAQELAFQLEALNARRKLETRLVEASAQSLLERDPSLLEYAALVLSQPEWDNGVAGIVAQRLADTYQRPAVLLCEKEELAFGSARSVAGCNITDALQACQARLLKFGGHAMAAGLTLKRTDIYDFRRDLSATVRAMLTTQTAEPALQLDHTLAFNALTPELYEDWQRLAPFGHGNPPLLLATPNVSVVRKKKLGRNDEHLRLTVTDETGAQQPLFWWNAAEQPLPAGRFDLAYRFVLNRYRQQTQYALEFVDLHELAVADTEAADNFSAIALTDYRQHAEPYAQLQALLAANPAALVWRENERGVNGQNRGELRRAETLIVWTIPPGPVEWQEALDLVQPRQVFLFGTLPEAFTVAGFLQRLAGLVKFTLKQKAGVTTVTALAAATAQRVNTVRYGLLWLQQSGQLGVTFTAGDGIQLSNACVTPTNDEPAALEKLIQSALAETLAYRKNWLARPGVESIINFSG